MTFFSTSGRPLERVIYSILALSAFLSVITTIGIIFVLTTESAEFFKEVSFFEFLFGTRWEPLLEPKSFGVLPLVSGTITIVIGAGLIALPIGIMTAIYLSEYASPKTRSTIKPTLEILAGIPTVVYGYFALTFITPLIRTVFPATQIFNSASASIVVGIMILPMVASLCDDAIRSVPTSLRQGGFSMGATTFEVTKSIVVPGAFSGIIASFVLAHHLI